MIIGGCMPQLERIRQQQRDGPEDKAREEKISCRRSGLKGANEWKNCEVSLWKINCVVERKGLPSAASGSQ